MTRNLEQLWCTRTMAKPLIILLLLELACRLPIAQSRPRDTGEHRGLYDDMPKSSQNNNGVNSISNSTQNFEGPSTGKYLDTQIKSFNHSRTVQDNKYERYISSSEADDGGNKGDLFRKKLNQDRDKQLVKSSLSKRKNLHKQRPKHTKHKILSNANLLKFDFIDEKDIQVVTPVFENTSKLEKNASNTDEKIDDDSHILHHEDLAKMKKDLLFDLNSFVKENPDLNKNTGMIEDDVMYQRDQGYQMDHDGELNHFGYQMKYGSKKESDLDDSDEDDDTDFADDDKRGNDENKQKDRYYGYYTGVEEKEHGGSLRGKDESERRTMKEDEKSREKQNNDNVDERTKSNDSEEDEDKGDEEKDDEKNKMEEKKDGEDLKKQQKEDADEEQDEENDDESKGIGRKDEEEREEKKQSEDGEKNNEKTEEDEEDEEKGKKQIKDGNEKEDEVDKEMEEEEGKKQIKDEKEEEKETDKDKVNSDVEPRNNQSKSGEAQYQFNPYAFNVEDIYVESRPIESCAEDFDCPPGRICKFGFCICGPPILCIGHKKPVCGSDGFLYPSHCELHRTACMKREHIWIDSDTKCMGLGQGQSQGQVETAGGKKGGFGSASEALSFNIKENNGADSSAPQSENGAEVNENQHSSANNGASLSSKSKSASGGDTDVNRKNELSESGQKGMVSEDGNTQNGESGVNSSSTISLDAGKENHRQNIPEGNGRQNIPEGNGRQNIPEGNGRQNIPEGNGRQNIPEGNGRQNIPEGNGRQMEGHYVGGKKEDSSNTSKNGESAEKRQPGSDSAYDSQRGIPETLNDSTSTSQSKDKINSNSKGKDTISSVEQGTADKENDTIIPNMRQSGEGNGLDNQQEESNVLGSDSATPASDEQKNKDTESLPKDADVNGTSGAEYKDVIDYSQQKNEQDMKGAKNFAVIGTMMAKSGSGVDNKADGKTNQTSQVPDKNKLQVENAMLNIKEGGEEMVSQEVEDEQQGKNIEEEEEEAGYQGDSPIFDKVQDQLFCTPQVLLRFKADVLRYHCVLFNEEHCDNESKEERQYVATEMFKYFDKDYNGFVEKEELWMLQLQENIDKISSVCSLLDLVALNDQGARDGKLTTDEFIQAFDIPDEVFEPKITTITTLATVGNDLEIRCSIIGDSSDFVWQKSGMDLSLIDAPEIHVFKDGTLYFEGVDIHHIGNYSCHQRNKPAVRQINSLSVIMKPTVKIESSTTVYPDQSEVIIHCHADGLPKPDVSWEFNGSPLNLGNEKFHLDTYQHTLTIRQAHYQYDTGSYKCIAVNKVGKAEDAVSIYINDPEIIPGHVGSASSKESFVVFHDNGYTIYEPYHCLTQRHVLGDFGNFHFIPEELDDVPSMCQSDGPCVWGSAITVKDRFVYVSQPQQNRILVVDATETLNPRQIVKTDRAPVQLHYVEANDEVWVLCWNNEEDYGTKTITIIREASKDVQHHIIHMQPISNRFDQVRNMFLPPLSDLDQVFKYGYAMHNEQQGLFKVDLQQKKYVKAIDFSPYNCVPLALAFIPIGGQVVIQCQQKSVPSQSDILLHMDTITDITVANFSKSGTPFVTPDSRRMAVVEKSTGRITVYQITDFGEIQEIFEVTTGSSVNDVIFHPADLHAGYDLYMTSSERSVIFSVSLENGKVETIKDVGDIDTIPRLPWLKKTPRFMSGNVFSNSLSVITKSALVILNDKYQDVQCRFNDLENPTAIAYASPN